MLNGSVVPKLCGLGKGSHLQAYTVGPFWLAQLRKGYSGVHLMEAEMLLNSLQCTGQSFTEKNDPVASG